MDTLVVCIAAAFSGLLFLGVAWLTRAGYWRTAAALLSGMVAAAFAFGVDRAAFEFGWWTYGKMDTHAPVAAYATTALWFGGGLGLVGWRMIRNWGGAGEALYFIGFVLLGLGRDFALSATGVGFAWGEGYLPFAVNDLLRAGEAAPVHRADELSAKVRAPCCAPAGGRIRARPARAHCARHSMPSPRALLPNCSACGPAPCCSRACAACLRKRSSLRCPTG